MESVGASGAGFAGGSGVVQVGVALGGNSGVVNEDGSGALFPLCFGVGAAHETGSGVVSAAWLLLKLCAPWVISSVSSGAAFDSNTCLIFGWTELAGFAFVPSMLDRFKVPGSCFATACSVGSEASDLASPMPDTSEKDITPCSDEKIGITASTALAMALKQGALGSWVGSVCGMIW